MNHSLHTADDLNTISSYLALRELPEISSEAIQSAAEINRAGLLILLGNSLLYTADIAALFMTQNLAEKILISGGIGHSTSYLKKASSGFLTSEQLKSDTLSEADILKMYLLKQHSVDAGRILTETRSSNCGANAEESFKVLDSHGISPRSIILIQDPTMQRRSHASFQKVWGLDSGVKWINFAPFVPEVELNGNELTFTGSDVYGLWKMHRFISLLMGEIPRLRDDSKGYGPKGKGYISHLDIPEKVEKAYSRLENIFTDSVRKF